MTPLRREKRGGIQERLAEEEVTEIVNCCGEPLGTSECVRNKADVSVCQSSIYFISQM